jgi:hypothetical protein
VRLDHLGKSAKPLRNGSNGNPIKAKEIPGNNITLDDQYISKWVDA